MKLILVLTLLTAHIASASDSSLKSALKKFNQLNSVAPQVDCQVPFTLTCSAGSGFNTDRKVVLHQGTFTLSDTQGSGEGLKKLIAKKLKVPLISQFDLKKIYLSSNSLSQTACNNKQGLIGSCSGKAKDIFLSLEGKFQTGTDSGIYSMTASKGSVTSMRVESKSINQPPYDLQIITTINMVIDGEIINLKQIQNYESKKSCRE